MEKYTQDQQTTNYGIWTSEELGVRPQRTWLMKESIGNQPQKLEVVAEEDGNYLEITYVERYRIPMGLEKNLESSYATAVETGSSWCPRCRVTNSIPTIFPRATKITQRI